jgi:L-ascorbate metabolism protein UlaG (beta-lactamase superfamily)
MNDKQGMKKRVFVRMVWCGLVVVFSGAAGKMMAQAPPAFTTIQYLTNKEVLLKLTAPAGTNCRVDISEDLGSWAPLAILPFGSGMNQYTDSAAPYLTWRWYRAEQLAETNVLTGDYLMTTAGEIVIHPVDHASFVMGWNRTNAIYCDPVGGAARYTGFPRASLILLTHAHSDHFDSATLTAVKASHVVLVAPQAVYSTLTPALKTNTIMLTNGAVTQVLGISIEAVPAYNLTSTQHPKGVGNGYVLDLGGKRIYISGDTEDTPEMRALQNIDVAFICMNQPYTMTVAKAASVVRQFQPKVVYPYHSSGSDVNSFKRQVGTDLGIEVRLRKWY